MSETYYHATPSANVPGILAQGLRPHGADSHVWGDYIDIPDGVVFLADSIVAAENWGSEVAQAVMRAEDPDYDPDAEAENYQPGPFDDEPWMPSHFGVEIAILAVQVPEGMEVETNFHPDGKEIIVHGSIPPENIRLVKTFTMSESPERFGFYIEASSTWGDDPETQRALEDLADAILSSPTHIEPVNPADYYGGTIQQGRGEILLDGEQPRVLYRVVDPAEWEEAERKGYLQSRGGYTRASAQPDERWRYQGEAGVRGYTLEIDYDPADEWTASAEGYAATWSRIPLSRVRRIASKTAAGKPFVEMSEGEFSSKRWVYHATSNEGDLETLLTQGVRMDNVPNNLARMRYEEGEYAEFAPGAGVGKGLYVSGSFWEVQGYGRNIVAIEILPGDRLEIPPESTAYDMESAMRDANGVLLASDVPSDRVHLVARGFERTYNDPLEMARKTEGDKAELERGRSLPPDDVCTCGHLRKNHRYYNDVQYPCSWCQCDTFTLAHTASKVASSTHPMVEALVRLRPWEWTSPDQVQAPFTYDANKSNEASQEDYPEPHIVLGPKFFTLPEITRKGVAFHEVGHLLSDMGLIDGWAWDLVNDLPSFGHLNGQTTPGEVAAEAWATWNLYPSWLETNAPGIAKVMDEVALKAGFPKVAAYETDPVGHTWTHLEDNIDEEALTDFRGMPSGSLDPSQPVYIRFGTWPPDERSTNWVEGFKEEGVSVYDVDDRGLPTIDWEGNFGNAQDDLVGRITDGSDPVFLVQGDFVGVGQDGEPLLNNVRVIRRIAADNEVRDVYRGLFFDAVPWWAVERWQQGGLSVSDLQRLGVDLNETGPFWAWDREMSMEYALQGDGDEEWALQAWTEDQHSSQEAADNQALWDRLWGLANQPWQEGPAEANLRQMVEMGIANAEAVEAEITNRKVEFEDRQRAQRDLLRSQEPVERSYWDKDSDEVGYWAVMIHGRITGTAGFVPDLLQTDPEHWLHDNYDMVQLRGAQVEVVSIEVTMDGQTWKPVQGAQGMRITAARHVLGAIIPGDVAGWLHPDGTFEEVNEHRDYTAHFHEGCVRLIVGGGAISIEKESLISMTEAQVRYLLGLWKEEEWPSAYIDISAVDAADNHLPVSSFAITDRIAYARAIREMAEGRTPAGLNDLMKRGAVASTNITDWDYSRVEEIQAAGVTEGQPIFRGMVIPKQDSLDGIIDAVQRGDRVGGHWSTEFTTATHFAHSEGSNPRALLEERGRMGVVLETSGWVWEDIEDHATHSRGFVAFEHEHEIPFLPWTDVRIDAIWVFEDRPGVVSPMGSMEGWVRHPVGISSFSARTGRTASRRRDAEEMGVVEGQPIYRFVLVRDVDIDFDSGMSLGWEDIEPWLAVGPSVRFDGVGVHWTTRDDLWGIITRGRVNPGEVPVRLTAEGWTWDQVMDHIDESYYYDEDHSNDAWGPEREIPIKPGTPLHITEVTWMEPDEDGVLDYNGNPQMVSIQATADLHNDVIYRQWGALVEHPGDKPVYPDLLQAAQAAPLNPVTLYKGWSVPDGGIGEVGEILDIYAIMSSSSSEHESSFFRGANGPAVSLVFPPGTAHAFDLDGYMEAEGITNEYVQREWVIAPGRYRIMSREDRDGVLWVTLGPGS